MPEAAPSYADPRRTSSEPSSTYSQYAFGRLRRARSRLDATGRRLSGIVVVLACMSSVSACGLVGIDISAVVADGGAADGESDAASTEDAAMDASVALCASGDCKRVFVSPAPGLTVADVAGVAQADARCQTLANGRSLGGTWRAWISDSTSDPVSRFTPATVPYRLLDGTLIANDFADLTDGSLANPIDVDVAGATASGVEVWTGTYEDGTYSGASCQAWTNTTNAAPHTYVGVTSTTDFGWSDIYLQFCDRTGLRIYCFEQ